MVRWHCGRDKHCQQSQVAIDVQTALRFSSRWRYYHNQNLTAAFYSSNAVTRAEVTSKQFVKADLYSRSVYNTILSVRKGELGNCHGLICVSGLLHYGRIYSIQFIQLVKGALIS